MEENTNVSQAVEEIKRAEEEADLKKVIEQWFERTRMEGLKLGAQMISLVVAEAIDKNLKNGMNSSHRDFQRAIKSVREIISVQLKQLKQQETVQNDLESVTEEPSNDE